MLNDIFLLISPSLELKKKNDEIYYCFCTIDSFFGKIGVVPLRVTVKLSVGCKSKL